ncbi:transglutaminase-like putative cysteine protease [Allocatelliglobosispora scoriae]|uniref:Transglutaminase-like putative cysteine protease n=1 Tax=Allocatelliglobosispora scoriae TaxID=643052 RepID=A0A841C4S9_9ACTN|nr:transglutaminaseTgpA domain-containing protein [Allocatelliglobosispora scoriae]MBB5874072.1 transglutaminase-like putative cysteine protease [Allocatelliglobosispora scoriae]
MTASTSTTGGSAPRTSALDLVVIALLMLVALTTLDSVYAGRGYLLAGAVGLAIGMGVAWLANRRHWTALTAVAAGLVLLILGAGPLALPETLIAHTVPTWSTLTGIWDGAVGGWRGLLTTVPPVVDDGPLLLVPYVSAFLAGLSAVLLAGRRRMLGAPLLPALLLLATGLLLGTSEPVSILLNGTVFAALALILVTVRQRRATGSRLVGVDQAKRIARSTTIVAIAAALAWAASLSPVVASADDRFVLREHVELPFDPNIYPSPLSGFRRYEVTQKKDVLFSVTGLPADARLRLAVMDTFDGVVWAVAPVGGRNAASGVFERVGARIPVKEEGARATVQVTIRDLGSVWVPTVGSATSVTFPGQRGRELTEAFRYNRVTATGVLSDHTKLREGDTIVLEAVIPPAKDWLSHGKSLAGQPVQQLSQASPLGAMDRVDAVVAERTTGMTGAAEVIDSLYKFLQAGDFSDGTGLAGSGLSVFPGHSAGRIKEFLSPARPVGDPEQYAAAYALMLRELHLPTRVVLGVRPKERNGATDVTGAMVTAWVEVLFDGAGWVAIDPTPEVRNKPRPPDPPAEQKGTAQLVQPPIAPELPPAQQPPPSSGDRPPPPPPPGCTWCATVLAILTYVGPPLLLVALVCALVIGVKTVRRRRRRSYDTPRMRVAGGWLELLDRLRDHRVPVPYGQTRRETVSALYRLSDAELAAAHKVAVRNLAHRADRTVFGPPEFEQADQDTQFWSDVEEAIHVLGQGLPFWRRLRALLNPVSLLPATTFGSGGKRR